MKPGRYKLRNPATGLEYVLDVRRDGTAFLSPNDGRVPSGQWIAPDTAARIFAEFIHS